MLCKEKNLDYKFSDYSMFRDHVRLQHGLMRVESMTKESIRESLRIIIY